MSSPRPREGRRIVFVLGGRVFFRFVDRIVQSLDAKGHSTIILTPNGTNLALDRCRKTTTGMEVIHFREEPYFLKKAVTALRLLRAYRHWLEPERAWPDFLRRRWATTEYGFPRWLRIVVRFFGLERFDWLLLRLPLRAVLEILEKIVPPNPRVVRQIRNIEPELVVCTPIVYPLPQRHTTEVEYLKAARSLNIPTAVVVASWDNLSMKGIFYIKPDLVLVWNEIQRMEAFKYHQISPDKVTATGASVFDTWFDRSLETSREAFLRASGLRAHDKYALYAESSDASGDEYTLVHNLARALDTARADSNLFILVRRHPSRKDTWPTLSHPRLKLYPVQSHVPDNEEARRVLFNSISHSLCIVGINTTAFLDAAIIDRPTIALLDPNKDYFQNGLVHFRYLLDANFLQQASGVDEAAEFILDATRGIDRGRTARREFVRSFIRPTGDQPARVSADTLVNLLRETEQNRD